jgi:hypothetical protein
MNITGCFCSTGVGSRAPTGRHRVWPWVQIALRISIAYSVLAHAGIGHAQGEAASLLAASVRADWNGLPVLDARSYHQFSSHEAPQHATIAGLDPGNQDYNHFLALCGSRASVRDQALDGVKCEAALEGFLLAADDGPGVITRMFFPCTNGAGFGAERLRIYIDDLASPAYDIALADVRAGTDPIFASPLAQYTSGALVIRVPLVYRTALRVLLDQLNPDALYYYHVDVQRGPVTETVPVAESVHEFSALREEVRLASAADMVELANPKLAAGQALTVFERDQPGTLRQLNLSLRHATAAVMRTLRLRVYWDRASQPALDLPLSELFGCSEDCVPFETLPLSLQVRASSLELEASWPMPFAAAARVELVNTGSEERELRTRVAFSSAPPAARSGYFHARANQRQGPFSAGESYLSASLRGAGKYLGVLQTMQGQIDRGSAAPFPLGCLEGDEQIVADGQTVALGTGTEDYFDGGWYFPDGPFSTPFGSLLVLASDSARGVGSATALRFHLLRDAVDYSNTFEISFEYGANRPLSATNYASVTFFYAESPSE